MLVFEDDMDVLLLRRFHWFIKFDVVRHFLVLHLERLRVHVTPVIYFVDSNLIEIVLVAFHNILKT